MQRRYRRCGARRSTDRVRTLSGEAMPLDPLAGCNRGALACIAGSPLRITPGRCRSRRRPSPPPWRYGNVFALRNRVPAMSPAHSNRRNRHEIAPSAPPSAKPGRIVGVARYARQRPTPLMVITAALGMAQPRHRPGPVERSSSIFRLVRSISIARARQPGIAGSSAPSPPGAVFFFSRWPTAPVSSSAPAVELGPDHAAVLRPEGRSHFFSRLRSDVGGAYGIKQPIGLAREICHAVVTPLIFPHGSRGAYGKWCREEW